MVERARMRRRWSQEEKRRIVAQMLMSGFPKSCRSRGHLRYSALKAAIGDCASCARFGPSQRTGIGLSALETRLALE